jgi:sensor domain CHASE-containing protein
MSDPVLIFILSILAGSLSGFATAAIYIRSRQQYLDEQALQLRKAARRLENATKAENNYLSYEHRNF